VGEGAKPAWILEDSLEEKSQGETLISMVKGYVDLFEKLLQYRYMRSIYNYPHILQKIKHRNKERKKYENPGFI